MLNVTHNQEQPDDMKYTVFATLFLAACSPMMEANRPDPVDMSRFTIGENKREVVASIGDPLSSAKEYNQQCDTYKLFTKGPNIYGRAAIATGEIVADVITLGTFESTFTTLEECTKNSTHTVVFCYDASNKLVNINQPDDK